MYFILKGTSLEGIDELYSHWTKRILCLRYFLSTLTNKLMNTLYSLVYIFAMSMSLQQTLKHHFSIQKEFFFNVLLQGQK